MAENLGGKVALVTGGASGIGQATAQAFARAGARVVVSDINAAGGEETVRAIERAKGIATFVRADVTRESEVVALIDRVVAAYGQLDCAHNNAGILGTPMVQMADYEEETWDRVIAVNLKGVWLCMKHELRHMSRHGGGSIVNTASVAGLIGGRFGAAYYASKHGVIGLTKAAAVEYAQQSIRINAVCPGFIPTPMTEPVLGMSDDAEARQRERNPMGRLGTPEDVAEAVVWLCSDSAAFMTGHGLVMDGGLVAQ